MRHMILSNCALRLAALALALVFGATALRAEDRRSLNGVALVIGQSKYEAIPALPNPANDAREMAKLLTDLGFDARSVSDRDASKLRRDLERFVEDAEGADVAFLYYSGHGIESGGENWLIPVDAGVSSLEDADEELVAVGAILDELKTIVPVTIVLLDACRTNPFPAGAAVRRQPGGEATPVGAGGLTPVRGATKLGDNPQAADSLGMVIGFAAEPGMPALDGDAGGNSPYATALLRHLGALDGIEFGQVMRMVTEEVYLDTGARQRPWVNESLRRMLFFGVPQDAPTGDEGLITGERRKLLLTIADLPTPNRTQVELAALDDGVPLDSLYGVLRALGAENIPEDPAELGKVLDAQAERLKGMLDRARALESSDPDTQRLVAMADRAIREGAIETARLFLDDAVSRVEQNATSVDDIEEELRKKRIADAAIYAQRADVAALAFDYRSAAADYGKAFDLVEKWDEELRWNYKNKQAEALHALGATTGERDASEAAIEAYRLILGYIPYGERNRDWAITRNNMAVVMQTLGEREGDTKNLEEALGIFQESISIFETEKDDLNWSAAQNNIGNVLLELGRRTADAARIHEAVAAYRSTLQKRDRSKHPLDWASSQNNIGLALTALAEREAGPELLIEADAAYRLALEEYTRERAPAEWAMVQNNLGNALNALGNMRAEADTYRLAADAYRSALEVRTKEQFPVQWARTQLNLGGTLSNMGQLETGTDSLYAAESAFREALTVLTREKLPLEWAALQNNLGSILQTIGQRGFSPVRIEESVAAFRSAMEEYPREKLPLDWAMTSFNMANSLRLIGGMNNDPVRLKEAADAYGAALGEYTRQATPRQWALAQAGLGSALQSLANYETDTRSLFRAIEAQRASLEVLTRENAPIEWANAQNSLGTCLLNLSNRESDAKYLAESRAAFEATTEIFTRDFQPMQWAFAINNIGDVHWSLGARTGERAEFEQALARFEEAKAVFVETGYAPVITLIDQKIDLIKQSLASSPQ
ncbi:MAG: caspase family protein [Rhizobiaceae bacterium]